MNKQRIDGKMFVYHGDETTSPPRDLAMGFASKLPYRAGMPGPSFSWSAFADSLNETIQVVESDRLVTIVIERLDESLVVNNNLHSSSERCSSLC